MGAVFAVTMQTQTMTLLLLVVCLFVTLDSSPFPDWALIQTLDTKPTVKGALDKNTEMKSSDYDITTGNCGGGGAGGNGGNCNICEGGFCGLDQVFAYFHKKFHGILSNPVIKKLAIDFIRGM